MSDPPKGPSYVETKAGPTFQRDGKAFLRSRDGKLSTVAPADANKAFESGDYLPASAEEVAKFDIDKANSTLGAKVKTGLESAAAAAIDTAQAPIALPLRLNAALWGDKDPLRDISGRATVGNLATIFGNVREGATGQTGEAYGREYAEGARERAEANPGSALAGNIAGSLVGGGALSGGARALGGAASKALGGGALAKAAGALTAGAVEGAAYGQAQAGEEAYIHDIPLTAEKLMASMGWGAVLGGGVSLGAHGIGQMFRKGSRGATPVDSPRIAGEDPVSRLDAAGLAGHTDEAALAGAGAEGRGLAGAVEAAEGSKFSGALREFADERTAKALGARGSVLKKLGRTAEQAQQTMGDMAKTVRGMVLDDGSKVFRPLDSQGELAERVALAKEQAGAKLSRFRDEADRVFEAHPEIAPRAESIADRIESEVVNPLASHPNSAIAAQAAPIRRLVDDVRALSRTQFETVQGASGRKIVRPKSGPPVTSVSDLTRLRQGLDEQIYQTKKGVNLPQQGAPPNLKDLERARGILEESIEAASDKAATHFDEAASQSYKELKTQWRHLNIADDIAGAAQLQDLGNRVVSPSDYGAGAIGSVLTGSPVGAVLSSIAHKAVREHSSAVLATLADKLANSLDGKLEAGLGAFFRESTQRAAAGASGLEKAVASVPLKRMTTPTAVDAFQGKSKDLRAAYQRRVQEITDATREGGAGARATVAKAMGGATEMMPRLTAAATVTVTRGAEYLESQLPAGTAAPTMFQPSRSFTPSDLQIREFAQKWSAVSNPLSVVDDLRRGTVTHAQIDALKAVYPELYSEVRVKALEGVRLLDQKGERMPFNDRLQLDLFLDLAGAGEPTLTGGFIDRVTKMQAQKQAQQGSHPPASNSQLNKLGGTRLSGSQGTLGGAAQPP